MRRRALLGLAGAPTAVVDQSLRSCFQTLRRSFDVQGIIGGPVGLLRGKYSELTGDTFSEGPRGGSALGAGRTPISPEDIRAIAARLDEDRIDALILAGGNGTMALLLAIEAEARKRGSGLRVVGIPKTVDNDLLGVAFAPGFGSAARFLASQVPELARDQAAMAGLEPIRVVETMGRNVGWLAAAATAGFVLAGESENVSLCLTPEQKPVSNDELFSAVEKSLSKRSRAFIVCSEGFSFGNAAEAYEATNHARLLHGGVARRLARALGAEFGVQARGEVLGTQQRSAVAFVSAADLEVSRLVGARAADFVLDGLSNLMVGFERTSTSELAHRFVAVELAEVAGASRALPEHFDPASADGREAFAEWLAPIVRTGVAE